MSVAQVKSFFSSFFQLYPMWYPILTYCFSQGVRIICAVWLVLKWTCIDSSRLTLIVGNQINWPALLHCFFTKRSKRVQTKADRVSFSSFAANLIRSENFPWPPVEPSQWSNENETSNAKVTRLPLLRLESVQRLRVRSLFENKTTFAPITCG